MVADRGGVGGAAVGEAAKFRNRTECAADPGEPAHALRQIDADADDVAEPALDLQRAGDISVAQRVDIAAHQAAQQRRRRQNDGDFRCRTEIEALAVPEFEPQRQPFRPQPRAQEPQDADP